MVESLLVFHWCSLENGNSVCTLVLKIVARVSFNSNVQSFFKVKENLWQSSKLFQDTYYNVSKRKKKRNKTRCFLFIWTWGHNYFTTNNAYWQENKWHENREPTANTWNISWENPHFSLNTCQWKKENIHDVNFTSAHCKRDDIKRYRDV